MNEQEALADNMIEMQGHINDNPGHVLVFAKLRPQDKFAQTSCLDCTWWDHIDMAERYRPEDKHKSTCEFVGTPNASVCSCQNTLVVEEQEPNEPR